MNELSCATETTRECANQAMVELVELFRVVWRMRPDAALVSQVPLKSVELAAGYFMSQWIESDPRNRDRWYFIRAIQNRAPVSTVLPAADTSGADYRHFGRPAAALGAAHLLDGLAVSLNVNSAWGEPWVTLNRSRLAEDDLGEALVVVDTVAVRHAADRAHVGCHQEWIQRAGWLDDLGTGADIWAHRAGFFPHLTFLPRVEGDLRTLKAHWVRPVAQRLLELEMSLAGWTAGQVASPEWKSRISDESETRRQKSCCNFADLDGKDMPFSLHARFTPGAGRIHFRLVPDDSTARVAYIGWKLPG